MISRDLTYAPLWNIFLITAGSVLFSLGAKGIVVHHNFITGGLFGTGLLIYYLTGLLTPGIWYLLFNIPIFLIGYFFVSKRFFLYSLYSMIVVTVSFEMIRFDAGVKNQLYAAIAGGIICGIGGGLILRSLGSGGGLDVIAVILNRKFNLGIGKFYLAYNAILFSFVTAKFEIDLLIASVIFVFISSAALDYMLSMFNQRKIVYIISNESRKISKAILQQLRHGATCIKAKGVYSGQDKEIVMTITNNIMLKRLEELVFTIDTNALFVVENTFNVIGSSFGKRKIY